MSAVKPPVTSVRPMQSRNQGDIGVKPVFRCGKISDFICFPAKCLPYPRDREAYSEGNWKKMRAMRGREALERGLNVAYLHTPVSYGVRWRRELCPWKSCCSERVVNPEIQFPCSRTLETCAAGRAQPFQSDREQVSGQDCCWHSFCKNVKVKLWGNIEILNKFLVLIKIFSEKRIRYGSNDTSTSWFQKISLAHGV